MSNQRYSPERTSQPLRLGRHRRVHPQQNRTALLIYFRDRALVTTVRGGIEPVIAETNRA